MEPRMVKYQLTRKEILDLIRRADCGTLCTNGTDGYPYGTPVNHVLIDDRIFFHGRRQGTRNSNIAADDRCSMTFVEERGYQGYGENACDTDTLFRSVIVYGHVTEVTDHDEKMAVLRALTDRLVPDRTRMPIDPARVDRSGVYEIIVERMTGKYRDLKPSSMIYEKNTGVV